MRVHGERAGAHQVREHLLHERRHGALQAQVEFRVRVQGSKRVHTRCAWVLRMSAATERCRPGQGLGLGFRGARGCAPGARASCA